MGTIIIIASGGGNHEWLPGVQRDFSLGCPKMAKNQGGSKKNALMRFGRRMVTKLGMAIMWIVGESIDFI